MLELACRPATKPATPPAPEPVPPPEPTAGPVLPVPTPVPPTPTPSPRITLTGTVTYLQRSALTPEAELQVELRDVTAADSLASPVVKQVIRRPGQVPIAFSLEIDPAKIRPDRAYAVSARITDRGQLQFVTETPVQVPAFGVKAPPPVEILVVPVK